MEVSWETLNFQNTAIFWTPFAIIAGVIIAWFGNYHVQKKIQVNSRLFHDIDNIKKNLRDFLDISTRYWTLESPRGELHNNLEAQIIATKHVIQDEYSAIARKNRLAKKSHQETETHRLALWQASTSGCFQQANWKPDPVRIRRITIEVRHIIRSLNDTI